MSSILRAPRVNPLPAALRHLARPTAPRFILLVSLTDLAAVMVAVGVGHLLPVGAIGLDASHSLDITPPPDEGLLGVSVIAAWLLCLLVTRAYGDAATGPLGRQSMLVVRATALLVGAFAVASLLLHRHPDRLNLVLVPLLGLILLLAGRAACHGLLLRARSLGHLVHRAVTLADGPQRAALETQLRKHPELGLTLVGSLAGPAVDEGDSPPCPDLDPHRVIATLRDLGADTLLVPMSQGGIDDAQLRALRWEMDAHWMNLVVVPPLNGVSGERMTLRVGNDLSLIHITTPTFSGAKYVLKRGFDILASALGILALTPVWLAIAAVVKFGDGGAVIFRQNRVGLDGREFPMFKFRTMVPDAEAVLAALEAARARDAGNTVMFKMRDDPRVTRPGRLLRRYSLDELPQLFNVLLGHMSLVGPRPPLPREVTEYEETVHRKFLIRPGITGLWQTSGRSNLTWEESVRLDLYYVENWTMRRDLGILLRTARAVVGRDGAF